MSIQTETGRKMTKRKAKKQTNYVIKVGYRYWSGYSLTDTLANAKQYTTAAAAISNGVQVFNDRQQRKFTVVEV